MDNDRYQHCNAVKAHAAKLGIELLFLPPYSPNLNLRAGVEADEKEVSSQ